MEILLLLLLMVSAAVLYLPEILKERALDSPLDTVSDFRRGMTALAVSTHNYETGIEKRNHYSASEQNEPGPYIRRSRYGDYDEGDHDTDFIPYPSNKVQMEMETRRHRVMVLLWIAALATGILMLFPNLKWIIPLHIGVLVLLAGYTLLTVLLPHYNRYG